MKSEVPDANTATGRDHPDGRRPGRRCTNEQEFRVDPAATSVVVQVGRAGHRSPGTIMKLPFLALRAASHWIQRTPAVPRVALQFDAKALTVTGKASRPEMPPRSNARC